MPDQLFQFGVFASTFGDDLRASASQARQTGFSGLLIPALTPSFRVTELSATGRREFRHLLSSQNQRLIGLTVDIGRKGFGHGTDVDQIIAQLDRIMESVSGLGAPLVCVELGALPAPKKTPRPRRKISAQEAGLIIIPDSTPTTVVDESTAPAKPDPAFVSQVDAAMRELGHRADRYSTVVAFRSDLSGFSALDRAIRSADCPWFGVDLDPVAILRDEWSLDEIFSSLGSSIRHMRVRDAILGDDKRTRPAVVGEGDTQWMELTANLRAADYHGWLTVDPLELPNRSSAAMTALAYLKRIATS